jgi:predicted nucleic acid-binding protein
MILCDTGPLVALLNQNDPQHTPCVEVLRSLPAQPLLTTLPCVGETMYLLYQSRRQNLRKQRG